MMMLEPVPPIVVIAWALLAGLVGAFIIRFRSDWREGVRAGAALVGAAVALGCFIWHARQDRTVHYKRVGEVLVNGEALRGKQLQVHGYVACGSVWRVAGGGDYRFKIQHLPSQPDVTLEVRYSGLVPDTFVEGNEVIVTGSLDDDGVLDAIPDGIMAKCGNRLPLGCGEAQ
jgi:cytochrome c-type biogenesis protein CcmE